MDEPVSNIVQTACAQFVKFGIRSISIHDICSELRISKKTFYRIFPKKEDLVEAVMAQIMAQIMEQTEKLCRNKNAIDALITIIKEVKKHSQTDCHTFYYDLEKYYPATFAQYRDKKAEWVREIFENILRRGIAEGYFRDDLDVELSAIFHSVQLKNSYNDILACTPKISQKRLSDFYIDVIVRLITNEKGLKYIEERIRG